MEVLELINKLLSLPQIDETIQEYGLNCLIKLYVKYDEKDYIKSVME